MFTRKIALHPTHIPQWRPDDAAPQPLSDSPEPARLPQTQTPAASAYEEVHAALHLSPAPHCDLSSFRHSWREPEFERLLQQLSSQSSSAESASLERRCLQMLGDLFQTRTPAGAATASRTQAVQWAGLAMLWNWRRHGRTPGQSVQYPNIITGEDASKTWTDFARTFDIEIRRIPAQDDRGNWDVEGAMERIDANTIGVVGSLGQQTTGNYDPLAVLDAGLSRLRRSTGHDVPMHIDAVGGFVAPFMTPELAWDFRLPHVKSIHLSGRNYGMVHPTSEWVVWREPAIVPDGLLNGDNDVADRRKLAGVVAQYYALLRLGRDGYTRIMRELQDASQLIARGLSDMRRFDLLSDGRSLPVVCAKLSPGSPYSVFDISRRLHDRGWLVPALRTEERNLDVLKIVVSEGFSRSHVETFLRDLQSVLKSLEAFPPPPDIEQRLLRDVKETLNDVRNIHMRIPLTAPARVS